MEPPSHEDVVGAFNDLISGTRTRKEVSQWAVSYIVSGVRIKDKRISQAIDDLGMVDLISTDRPYLYDEGDFREWLREFEREA